MRPARHDTAGDRLRRPGFLRLERPGRAAAGAAASRAVLGAPQPGPAARASAPSAGAHRDQRGLPGRAAAAGSMNVAVLDPVSCGRERVTRTGPRRMNAWAE